LSLVLTDIGNYEHEDDPGEACYGRTAKRRSVTRDDEAALAKLFAGKTVLEIGTGLGVSTRALASTAEHVFTCDPDPWVASTIAPDLPANVTFSADPWEMRADGAFIDGCHGYDETRRDINHAVKWTDCDPLVVHDTNIPNVLAAIQDSGFRIVEHFTEPAWMARIGR
jgi:hypothetical protein